MVTEMAHPLQRQRPQSITAAAEKQNARSENVLLARTTSHARRPEKLASELQHGPTPSKKVSPNRAASELQEIIRTPPKKNPFHPRRRPRTAAASCRALASSNPTRAYGRNLLQNQHPDTATYYRATSSASRSRTHEEDATLRVRTRLENMGPANHDGPSELHESPSATPSSEGPRKDIYAHPKPAQHNPRKSKPFPARVKEAFEGQEKLDSHLPPVSTAAKPTWPHRKKLNTAKAASISWLASGNSCKSYV